MKKIVLFILLGSLLTTLPAQTFEWAKRGGLWAYDHGQGVSTDLFGNVYVAGKYEMAADFDGIILPERGNHDIYVAQYNSAGNLNWIRTAGGILGDYAHALVCDGSGAVYITGEIEGWSGDTISFDGSPVKLTCAGDNDVFIAKYDLSGNLIWAKSAGGYKNDKALGITCDNSGNIYVCGLFEETAFFNGTTIYGNPGERDIFIAKYDTNGNFQWVKQAGGAGRDEAKAIACDAAGNVYICGMYSDGATFGSTTFTTPNTPTGQYFDVFLAKYAADGTLQWVKSAGGDYDDVAWGITIDNTDKIYITGEFNAHAFFDSLSLITSGSADVFVACYDINGNVQWTTPAGGNLIDRARALGSDGTNIYVTGQFGNTAAFGSYTLVGVDSSDIFIAALNNTGNYIWATAVGGIADSLETFSYESGNAIDADTSGNIYTSGSILNGGIFGSIALAGWGRTDAFICKIPRVIISLDENVSQEKILFYPNPSNGNFILDLSQLPDQKTETVIYNCLGQVIYTRKERTPIINVNLPEQEKGIYLLEIRTEDHNNIRYKLIFQ